MSSQPTDHAEATELGLLLAQQAIETTLPLTVHVEHFLQSCTPGATLSHRQIKVSRLLSMSSVALFAGCLIVSNPERQERLARSTQLYTQRLLARYSIELDLSVVSADLLPVSIIRSADRKRYAEYLARFIVDNTGCCSALKMDLSSVINASSVYTELVCSILVAAESLADWGVEFLNRSDYR